MFQALKRLFNESGGGTDKPAFERRQPRLAIAVLLYEATRFDPDSHAAGYAAAKCALADLFGLDGGECTALLEEARAKNGRLTSYFSQISEINRYFSMQQRIALIEHLWRIAYAHGQLDQYEDHFVRKIAYLLYVPNTQCMVARARARTKA